MLIQNVNYLVSLLYRCHIPRTKTKILILALKVAPDFRPLSSTSFYDCCTGRLAVSFSPGICICFFGGMCFLFRQYGVPSPIPSSLLPSLPPSIPMSPSCRDVSWSALTATFPQSFPYFIHFAQHSFYSLMLIKRTKAEFCSSIAISPIPRGMPGIQSMHQVFRSKWTVRFF